MSILCFGTMSILYTSTNICSTHLLQLSNFFVRGIFLECGGSKKAVKKKNKINFLDFWFFDFFLLFWLYDCDLFSCIPAFHYSMFFLVHGLFVHVHVGNSLFPLCISSKRASAFKISPATSCILLLNICFFASSLFFQLLKKNQNSNACTHGQHHLIYPVH